MDANRILRDIDVFVGLLKMAATRPYLQDLVPMLREQLALRRAWLAELPEYQRLGARLH